MHRYLAGRNDTYFDLAVFDIEQLNLDIVADHDTLVFSTR